VVSRIGITIDIKIQKNILLHIYSVRNIRPDGYPSVDIGTIIVPSKREGNTKVLIPSFETLPSFVINKLRKKIIRFYLFIATKVASYVAVLLSVNGYPSGRIFR
jgi:hypothetical protein